MPARKSKKTKSEKRTTDTVLPQINKMTPCVIHSHRVLYWLTILILIIANLIVSVVLVPFLLVVATLPFYLVVISLGLVFGLVFNHLLTDIENLETRHHITAVILLPLLAIINLFIMIGAANRLAFFLELGNYEDPVFVSLIYVLFFILPYLVAIIRQEGILRKH